MLLSIQDSNIDIYQRMWQHMSAASPPALVASYEEGVRRVLAGNYAFLMESTMLDHRVQRDCNLTQVGGLLDSKVPESAIATVLNLYYRKILYYSAYKKADNEIHLTFLLFLF